LCIRFPRVYKRLSAPSIARYRLNLSSDTPFGLVWQPRQGNLLACGQAGLGGYSVGRMNCGAYVVDVVYIAAVAAAAVIHQTPTLVADVADEGARSTDLVGSEGGRRQVRRRPLKVREGEHSTWRYDVEA
jgi:hypothetical protein